MRWYQAHARRRPAIAASARRPGYSRDIVSAISDTWRDISDQPAESLSVRRMAV